MSLPQPLLVRPLTLFSATIIFVAIHHAQLASARDSAQEECENTARYRYAVWEDGACHCTNCGQNPPYCTTLNCHGAPYLDANRDQCDSSRCPEGRLGECCQYTKCQNGGFKMADDRCNCENTNYIGEFCEEKIKQCQNNGVKNEITNRCSCPEDYTGPECEILRCYNDQEFIDGACQCDEERFEGKFCEKHHCRFGSVKKDSDNERSQWCSCKWLFVGVTCSGLSDGGIAFCVVGCMLGLVCCCGGGGAVAKKRQEKTLYQQTPVEVTGHTGDTNTGGESHAIGNLPVTVDHSHVQPSAPPNKDSRPDTYPEGPPPAYGDIVKNAPI